MLQNIGYYCYQLLRIKNRSRTW